MTEGSRYFTVEGLSLTDNMVNLLKDLHYARDKGQRGLRVHRLHSGTVRALLQRGLAEVVKNERGTLPSEEKMCVVDFEVCINPDRAFLRITDAGGCAVWNF